MGLLTGLGIFILILIGIFYVLPLFGTWILTIVLIQKDQNFRKSEIWIIWLLAIIAVIPSVNIISFIGLLYVITNN